MVRPLLAVGICLVFVLAACGDAATGAAPDAGLAIDGAAGPDGRVIDGAISPDGRVIDGAIGPDGRVIDASVAIDAQVGNRNLGDSCGPSDNGSLCAAGLLCCYPCGRPGCIDVCQSHDAGTCPLLP